MIRAATNLAVRRAPLHHPALIHLTTPTLGAKAATARFSSSSSSSSATILPERSLWDTIYSGTKGIVSLTMSEEARQRFMDVVQGSVINAEVLKQARFGNMLTLALFYDLQDPLFQKYKFDASDFLEGVKPSLKKHHDIVGQLRNEFPAITSQEERTEKLLQRMQQIVSRSMQRGGSSSDSEDGDDASAAAADNAWVEQAQKDPDSLAGQLNKMVTPKLLDTLFYTSEIESLTVNYEISSTTISNVALLSARAMVMDDDDGGEDNDDDGHVEHYDGTEDTAGEFMAEDKVSMKAKEPKKDVDKAAASKSEENVEKIVVPEGEENIEKIVAPESEKEPAAPTVEASATEGRSKTFLEKKKEMEAIAKLEAEVKEVIAEAKATNDEGESDKDVNIKMEATETESIEKDASSENQQIEEEAIIASKPQATTRRKDNTAVAAQIEVLYELNQTTAFKEAIMKDVKGEDGEEQAEEMFNTKPSNEMQVLVGTFEGYLNGGPDGGLRWRITNLRTPYDEFPLLKSTSLWFSY